MIKEVFTQRDSEARPSVLGEAIQERVQRLGISQASLAKVLNERMPALADDWKPVDPAFVSRLIYGNNARKHRRAVGVLCEHLAITLIENDESLRARSAAMAEYLSDPIYANLAANHQITLGALRGIAGDLEPDYDVPYALLLDAVLDVLRYVTAAPEGED